MKENLGICEFAANFRLESSLRKNYGIDFVCNHRRNLIPRKNRAMKNVYIAWNSNGQLPKQPSCPPPTVWALFSIIKKQNWTVVFSCNQQLGSSYAPVRSILVNRPTRPEDSGISSLLHRIPDPHAEVCKLIELSSNSCPISRSYTADYQLPPIKKDTVLTCIAGNRALYWSVLQSLSTGRTSCTPRRTDQDGADTWPAPLDRQNRSHEWKTCRAPRPRNLTAARPSQ